MRGSLVLYDPIHPSQGGASLDISRVMTGTKLDLLFLFLLSVFSIYNHSSTSFGLNDRAPNQISDSVHYCAMIMAVWGTFPCHGIWY